MDINIYKEKIDRLNQTMKKRDIDLYRCHYHLMPLTGKLGDPNGMYQYNGVYHIFYVYLPLSFVESKRTPCVWGHYSTLDFIHYKINPIALYPDHPRDKDGAYSGSLLLDEDKRYIYYTGNVRYDGDYDYVLSGREQNVMRVESSDGINFSNKKLIMTNDDYPENVTQHVRDPFLFKENGKLYMFLGARNKNGKGIVLVYEGEDLEHFHYLNEISTQNTFGYMWECPDFFQIENQQILVACPQGVEHEEYRFQNKHQCGYFFLKGDFKKEYILSDFYQFDYGFDYYAARTFLDQKKRRILIGWLGMSEADYSQSITFNNGWDQVIALPRELIYKDGHIYQQPLKEYKQLRKKHQQLNPKNHIQIKGLVFEMVLRFHHSQDITIRLREDCEITYNQKEKVLILSMDTCGDGRTVRKMKLSSLEKIQIFSDVTSLELFINDGYATMSTRIFGNSKKISISSFEGFADYYEMSAFQLSGFDN